MEDRKRKTVWNTGIRDYKYQGPIYYVSIYNVQVSANTQQKYFEDTGWVLIQNLQYDNLSYCNCCIDTGTHPVNSKFAK